MRWVSTAGVESTVAKSVGTFFVTLRSLELISHDTWWHVNELRLIDRWYK